MKNNRSPKWVAHPKLARLARPFYYGSIVIASLCASLTVHAQVATSAPTPPTISKVSAQAALTAAGRAKISGPTNSIFDEPTAVVYVSFKRPDLVGMAPEWACKTDIPKYEKHIYGLYQSVLKQLTTQFLSNQIEILNNVPPIAEGGGVGETAIRTKNRQSLLKLANHPLVTQVSQYPRVYLTMMPLTMIVQPPMWGCQEFVKINWWR